MDLTVPNDDGLSESFVATLRRKWREIFLDWQFAIAFFVGASSGILASRCAPSLHLDVYFSAVAGAGAGLLGVALAAMAIVVSYLHDDALLAFAHQDRTLTNLMWPFRFTAILTATCVALGLAGLLLLDVGAGTVLSVLVGASSGLVAWTLFWMVALVGHIGAHARLRLIAVEGERSSEVGSSREKN